MTVRDMFHMDRINVFTEELGCWIDGSYGQYMGEEIQKLADHFASLSKIPLNQYDRQIYSPDHKCDGQEHCECYYFQWEAAEEYLNNYHAGKNRYFGSNPDTGDFGLWIADEDDEDDPPQGGIYHVPVYGIL